MMWHKPIDLDEARDAYQSLLQREPRNVVALSSLGVIALETNDAARAIEFLGKAIELDPSTPALHIGRGRAFAMVADHAAAIACYDLAIALDSESSALPFYHRGISFQELGQHREAISSFGQAIALESDLDGVAYYARGTSQIALTEQASALESLQKAIEHFGTVIADDPKKASTFHNRGNAYTQLRMWESALNDYNSAIALEPKCAEAHADRSYALAELRCWDDALTSVEMAIGLIPNKAVLHYNRGNLLTAIGRTKNALESFNRAISLDGSRAPFFYNRGIALNDLRELEAALDDFDRVIELSPELAEAHAARCAVLRNLHRFDEALVSIDMALMLNPDAADYHYSKAFNLLLTGQLQQGWQEYEWRLRQDNRHLYGQVDRNYSQPRWTGGEDLCGKTLFLYGEQGLGDTIQFCRYAALAANLGARVILEVPDTLFSLLRSLSGVVDLVHEGDAAPVFDFHCSLMSLPMAFKTTIETIPRVIPYLACSGRIATFWKEKLGSRTKPRVGLAWSGGVRQDLPDRLVVPTQRNIPLSKLQSFKNADVQWFSLQKGQPAESELDELVRQNWNGPQLIDYTYLFDDFADTASLVQQLDLVISVDTSVAHLAGALGKPVWILNRYDTCWRWMLERADSPWYPTARLYRQESEDDWDNVIQRVLEDLKRLVSGQGP